MWPSTTTHQQLQAAGAVYPPETHSGLPDVAAGRNACAQESTSLASALNQANPSDSHSCIASHT